MLFGMDESISGVFRSDISEGLVKYVEQYFSNCDKVEELSSMVEMDVRREAMRLLYADDIAKELEKNNNKTKELLAEKDKEVKELLAEKDNEAKELLDELDNFRRGVKELKRRNHLNKESLEIVDSLLK